MSTAEPAPASRDVSHGQLAAESITVRIRWFGLCVGYVLVNLIDRGDVNAGALNAILTLGAVYAAIDTWFSLRGRVFLNDVPLLISAMEAIFIGLLCHFDGGLESPFRFYYFLSLLVAAIRHSPHITYATFALHSLSFSALAIWRGLDHPGAPITLLIMLVLMGWVTWASTSLASLIKAAGVRLAELNGQLTRQQALLEERIQERTRELQQSQAMLVQQEKQAAFGLLAAGIAHEVGNPLAAISSIVQMLNRRSQDDYTRERLPMVDDQLRRIQRTLRELVDFSRPATTTQSLCDIHEVLDASLSIAKYYKRKKGKRIDTQFGEKLPRVRIVRDQVVQVFLNLILNALDATEEGGTIQITTTLNGGWIDVAVTDDGHGIAPDDQSRIFQPYFTTKKTGTGLGLFVCRRLLEQMGEGRIELASSSSTGTTFIVSLKGQDPAVRHETNEPAAPVAGSAEPAPSPPHVPNGAWTPTVPALEPLKREPPEAVPRKPGSDSNVPVRRA